MFIGEIVTGGLQPLHKDGIWRICGTQSTLWAKIFVGIMHVFAKRNQRTKTIWRITRNSQV
jgi:hypothetical protein